jgi:Restriction endonuclease
LLSAGHTACVFDEPPLVTAYRDLAQMQDAQARGSALEGLVKKLFSRAHFRVERDAGAAAPRQTDLVATNGTDNYLIEVKWRQDPADVSDVDNVRIRLQETPSSMIGVLISVNGFTATARERVRAKRSQPILLMTGPELASALANPPGLRATLDGKREELLVHGRVLVDAPPERLSWAGAGRPSGMPAGGVSFLLDGERRQVLACGGGFGQFVFVQEVPDIDWVPGGGTGVSIDMSSSVGSQDELLTCLAELTESGWLTPHGRWNIQQATRNWHGIGPETLAEEITGWERRYDSAGPIHHTEQLCYQDTCEGGFFTLTADITAAEPRELWHCELSAQLSGVPLDQAPLRQLAALLRASHPLYFRPRGERAVTRHALYADNLTVVPAGLVVFDDAADPTFPAWVCGIVTANPFALPRGSSESGQPDWIPGDLGESEMLICALRQYHPLSHPVAGYRLTSCEWVWTSDSLVIRATADWKRQDSDPAVTRRT